MEDKLNNLKELYTSDGQKKSGMRTSGLVAEELFLNNNKDFRKNNDNNKTAIDLIDSRGHLWDLKLCSASKYGSQVFHELIQNTSPTYWSISDTLNDKASGWIYWDLSDADCPYYTLDRKSLEEYLGCSLKELKESFEKKKPYFIDIQPEYPSLRCLNEDVRLTRGGFKRDDCKNKRQAVGIKLPTRVFNKHSFSREQ